MGMCCLSVDGRLIREEQYVKSLKQNSIGPTEAFCIDQQQCIRRSTAGFAVERKVFTPKVSRTCLEASEVIYRP